MPFKFIGIRWVSRNIFEFVSVERSETENSDCSEFVVVTGRRALSLGWNNLIENDVSFEIFWALQFDFSRTRWRNSSSHTKPVESASPTRFRVIRHSLN